MSFTRLLYKVLVWRAFYFISAFALNILFVRYYYASGSSSVYYLINLYSFVLLFASLSIEVGMSYFLAKKEIGEGSLTVFSLLWTIIFSILSLLALKIYFHFFDKDISKDIFVLTVATYIPGQLLLTFFTAFFYARESAILPNILPAMINVLLILLIPAAHIIPSGIDRPDYLRIYFFGILAQGLILSVVFYVKYGRQEPLSMLSPDMLRKIFRYSLIAFTANLAFFLVYRVDYWFVKKYCSASELGNYIQVSKLGQMILVVPGILAGAIFPRTVLKNGEIVPDHLARMSRIAVLFFVVLFLLLLFSGRQLFPLVFGSSFDKMYLPALIILPGILFLSILTMLSAYFGGMHQPGINAKVAFAGLVVMIAGDALFIPRYRITGAAAVSSVAYFACTLYSVLHFTKRSHIGLWSMLIVKKEDWYRLRGMGKLSDKA